MFFPSSLKGIAEAFKLPMQKGDFPHNFNILGNENYVGRLPPLDSHEDYFSLSTKTSKRDIDEIREWYVQQTQVYCTCDQYIMEGQIEVCGRCHKRLWSFQEEIQKYCWLDVDILAECAKRFRQAFLTVEPDDVVTDEIPWRVTPMDIFRCTTLAQTGLTLFLQGHAQSTLKMRPAVSKPRARSGFSAISIIWLERMREQLPPGYRIAHMANSGFEHSFSGVKGGVDGYVDLGIGGIAYEFLGCYWHACPKCYATKLSMSIHPTRNIPWGLILENTTKKIQGLKTVLGPSNVIVKWECEFKEDLRTRPMTPTNQH
jgi:hypothetical protein